MTPYALSASVMPLPNRKRYVKEMDQHDIDHVIEQYANCADRLCRAGFDMCMIHGGHGNLIGQFMSPSTNFRNDWYGGSFENRMRFALQVMEAMRAKVGSRMAIEMRISGDEMIPNGMHLDEVCKFLPMTQKYIDMVNISRGLIVDHNYHFYTQPPYYNEYCHNVKYATEIKKVLDIPVSVVGSIMTLKDAHEIVTSGSADVVAMCRQLMADPETIKKSVRGDEEDVRPCLRCLQVCNKNVDEGRPVRCAVNPTVGREGRYATITPAPKKKKVVVVGGGPAGMMATQTLRQRGHDVVLFEQTGELGGHLPSINKLPFKEDLRRYTAWDIHTTLTCGADVRLNTKATPGLIEKEKPDAVLIATGSKLMQLNIPGSDGENVVDVISVDSGRVKTGQKVVICGGGMSGLECALGLAMEGKQVTVVDMVPVDDFAKDIVNFTRNMLLKQLREHNVTLVGSQKVSKITPAGIETIDRDWRTYQHDADTVVLAFGLVPNSEDFNDLSNVVPDTQGIGDCWYGVKTIGNANMTAFNYAVEL